jgi:hypothetical protein
MLQIDDEQRLKKRLKNNIFLKKKKVEKEFVGVGIKKREILGILLVFS